MNKSIALSLIKVKKSSIFLDILALFVVGFIPAFSHLTGFPLYYMEPMRIMVILALIHTTKSNAYVLAVVLPVLSFFVSGHPGILKALLIVLELIVNIWFFSFFCQFLRSRFLSMSFSIVVSKTVYYLLKAGFISVGLLSMAVFATPLLIQLIVTLVLAAYTFLIQRSGRT